VVDGVHRRVKARGGLERGVDGLDAGESEASEWLLPSVSFPVSWPDTAVGAAVGVAALELQAAMTAEARSNRRRQ